MVKKVSAFFLSVAAVGVFGSVTLPDPVIWWKMDETVDGKVPDASGNGHDLTLGPGVSLAESPLRGKALFTDGTVRTWATFSAPGLGSRTLSFWAHRNATDNDDSITSEQNAYPYIYKSSDFILMLQGTSANFRLSLGSSHKLPFYKGGPRRLYWDHHVFVVTQAATNAPGTDLAVCNVAYYRNGALRWQTEDAAVSGGFQQATATALLLNNASNNEMTRPFYGGMDEFRLYGTALTKEQIAAEFRRPFEENEAKLIGHWPFDTVFTDPETGNTMTPETTGLAGPLIVGPEVTQTNAVHGNGFYFNGLAGSGVSGLTNNLTILHDATITGWLNVPPEADQLSTLIGGNSYPQIYRFGNYASRAEIQQARTERRLRLFWRDDVTARYLGPYLSCRGEWSHFAISYTHRYDAAEAIWYSRAKIYINGALAATGEEQAVKRNGENDTLLTDPYKPLAFGNAAWDGNRPILGCLDEMSIWSGVLSDAQIRELARTPAAVTAGDDFTVTGTDAELRAVTTAGTVRWTQVSGPAAAEIETSDTPVTRVTLPAEGVYVFRVETTGLTPSVESDEVCVTRTAAVDGNQPPVIALPETASAGLSAALPLTAVVNDPDAGPGPVRVTWRRVSGPGGVWFSDDAAVSTRASFAVAGDYVLACSASDGAATADARIAVTVSAGAAATLPDGLARAYTADDPRGPFVESVSGGDVMASPDYTKSLLADGRGGLGFKVVDTTTCFDSGLPLPETAVPDTYMPANRFMTFSAWVYYDPTMIDASRTAIPAVFAVKHSLALSYERSAATGANGCFVLYLYGYANAVAGSGTACERFCFAEAPTDPAGRWMHVCLIVDRVEGWKHALYLDGVKIEKHAEKTYSTGISSGFVRSAHFMIGGCETGGWPSDGTMKDLCENKLVLGSFPGVLDDVFVWTRELSANEIAEVAAADPGLPVNRAPQVTSVALTDGRTVLMSKIASRLEATVYDDGLPSGATCTYAWEVVSGSAEAVTFASPAAVATDVTVTEPGDYKFRLRVSDGDLVTYGAPLAVKVVPACLTIVIR